VSTPAKNQNKTFSILQVLRESLVQINNDVKINSDEELSQEESEFHFEKYSRKESTRM
jgi:hypothetical protein